MFRVLNKQSKIESNDEEESIYDEYTDDEIDHFGSDEDDDGDRNNRKQKQGKKGALKNDDPNAIKNRYLKRGFILQQNTNKRGRNGVDFEDDDQFDENDVSSVRNRINRNGHRNLGRNFPSDRSLNSQRSHRGITGRSDYSDKNFKLDSIRGVNSTRFNDENQSLSKALEKEMKHKKEESKRLKKASKIKFCARRGEIPQQVVYFQRKDEEDKLKDALEEMCTGPKEGKCYNSVL